ILGVAEIHMLGYRDSGMPGSEANKHPQSFASADPEEAVGKLVEIIRKERPEVILSYDESRGYDHPDHVKVHAYGLRAFHEAGDPNRFPDKGAPWKPLKLYYFATFTKKRFQLLNDAAVAAGNEAPFAGWLENWDTMGFAEPEITAQIDVADHVELRSKALLAHATQIDPDSFWFAIPDEMQREVYPWEDYTLIASHVDTQQPESDLFAGVTPFDQ
ncbi:MAG: PIG-L deacetylase family protein, partial [Actinomycetota bacterium]